MNQIKKVNEIFLITVMIAVGGSLLLGTFSFSKNNELVSLLLSQIIYVIPTVLYLGMSRGNLKERLRINRVKGSTVILLILFSYLISPLLSYLNAVSMLFSKNRIQNTVYNIVVDYPLIVGIIAVALIPCILEETVYRGVFFNEYRKVNAKKGILISGLLFGLMHMNWNQFVYAFVMGMIFAVVVEACDSIIASMIVHFTINSSSVVMSYLQAKKVTGIEAQNLFMKKDELVLFLSSYWIVVIIFCILAFYLLKRIAKIQGRMEEFKKVFSVKKMIDSKEEAFLTLPIISGILVCIIIMIGVEIS